MAKKPKKVLRVKAAEKGAEHEIKFTHNGVTHPISKAGVTGEDLIVMGKREKTRIKKEGILKLIAYCKLSKRIESLGAIEGIALKVTVGDKAAETEDVGEASDLNLRARGSKWPWSTALARGTERAVIQHLRIYGVLGESEVDDEPVDDDDSDEESGITAVMDKLLNVKNKKGLKRLVKTIKGMSLADTQKETLKGLVADAKERLGIE